MDRKSQQKSSFHEDRVPKQNPMLAGSRYADHPSGNTSQANNFQVRGGASSGSIGSGNRFGSRRAELPAPGFNRKGAKYIPPWYIDEKAAEAIKPSNPSTMSPSITACTTAKAVAVSESKIQQLHDTKSEEAATDLVLQIGSGHSRWATADERANDRREVSAAVLYQKNAASIACDFVQKLETVDPKVEGAAVDGECLIRHQKSIHPPPGKPCNEVPMVSTTSKTTEILPAEVEKGPMSSLYSGISMANNSMMSSFDANKNISVLEKDLEHEHIIQKDKATTERLHTPPPATIGATDNNAKCLTAEKTDTLEEEKLEEKSEEGDWSDESSDEDEFDKQAEDEEFTLTEVDFDRNILFSRFGAINSLRGEGPEPPLQSSICSPITENKLIDPSFKTCSTFITEEAPGNQVDIQQNLDSVIVDKQTDIQTVFVPESAVNGIDKAGFRELQQKMDGMIEKLQEFAEHKRSSDKRMESLQILVTKMNLDAQKEREELRKSFLSLKSIIAQPKASDGSYAATQTPSANTSSEGVDSQTSVNAVNSMSLGWRSCSGLGDKFLLAISAILSQFLQILSMTIIARCLALNFGVPSPSHPNTCLTVPDYDALAIARELSKSTAEMVRSTELDTAWFAQPENQSLTVVFTTSPWSYKPKPSKSLTVYVMPTLTEEAKSDSELLSPPSDGEKRPFKWSQKKIFATGVVCAVVIAGWYIL